MKNSRTLVRLFGIQLVWLEWKPHLEDRPIREAQERKDHISPEHQYVGSFGKIQISEQNEYGRLGEEQERHLDHVARIRHQCDDQCPKAKYPKHTCHDSIPLSRATIQFLLTIIQLPIVPCKPKTVTKWQTF
jgi:hypothetical protein